MRCEKSADRITILAARFSCNYYELDLSQFFLTWEQRKQQGVLLSIPNIKYSSPLIAQA